MWTWRCAGRAWPSTLRRDTRGRPGQGFEKIFTFVRADNPAALAAYHAHGFETIGTARRHARIDGRYVDEWFIERQL